MMGISSGMTTTIYYACVENIRIATNDMVLNKTVAEEKKENVSRGLQKDSSSQEMARGKREGFHLSLA